MDISHQRMIELSKSGHLTLGINNSLAEQISKTGGKMLKNSSVAVVYQLWTWIVFGIFVYTVYLSFTVHWWWFLFGSYGAYVIWEGVRKGNSKNILRAAMEDNGFYDKVKSFGRRE